MPRGRSPFYAANITRRKRVDMLLSNPHLSKCTDSLYQGCTQVSERGNGILSSSSNSVIRIASIKTVTAQEETLNHEGTEGESPKVLEEEITHLTNDLRKLERHLSHQMGLKVLRLSANPSHCVYVQLSVLTAAKIILCNKPRADAVMHLTVKLYNDQSTKMDPDDETLQCLSIVEKKLCERLQLVKTVDKEGQLVPILLTPQTRKAVRLLVENRPLANIKRTHPHIFANLIDTSVSPVEILNTVSEIAQLANPGLLQDTRFQKHVATISQIMAMQAQELKWLSSRIATWEKVEQCLKGIQRSTAEMVTAVQLLHEMDSAQGYHSTDETLSGETSRAQQQEHGKSDGKRRLTKCTNGGTCKPVDNRYLIKIEVQRSGILFRDLHQYLIASKPRTIDSWKQKHGLNHLAIPKHVAFGQFEHNKILYYFLVFEGIGYDLQHKLKILNYQMKPADAYSIAIQLVNAIEYLHSIGFVEADIEPTKIMKTHEPSAKKKVVLVDFGLAVAFTPSGRSRERFVHMLQKAHSCALEYMSRDAHNGDAPTKRSDIEILAYNLVHWLSGKLPWEGVKDKNEVSRLKTENMEKIDSFLAHCFGEKKFAPQLLQLLEYVRDLEYEETPSYSCVQQLLKDAMKYHFKLRGRASRQRCKARKTEQLTGTTPAPRVMASQPRTSNAPIIISPSVGPSEQTESTILPECPRLSDENVSHLKRKAVSDINACLRKRVRILLNSKEVLSPSLRIAEPVRGQKRSLHLLQNKDAAVQQPGDSNLLAEENADFHPAPSLEVKPSMLQEGVDVDKSSGVTIQVKIEPDDPEYDETEMKCGREGVLETWTVMVENAMSCFDVKPEPESEEDEGVSGQEVDQKECIQQRNISPETNALSCDDVMPEPCCEKSEDVLGQEIDQSGGIQQGNLSPETDTSSTTEDTQEQTEEKFSVRSSVNGFNILEDSSEPIEEKYSDVLRRKSTVMTAADVGCSSRVINYAGRDNMKMEVEAN